MKRRIETNFEMLLSDLIKPFEMVMGKNAKKIAENVFRTSNNSFDELNLISIGKEKVVISFKKGVKTNRKKKILKNITKDLIRRYKEKAGRIAKSMIEFVIKDYKIII